MNTQELVKEYKKTGKEILLQEIINQNKGLVWLWGKDYCITGYDVDDLEQEAYITLLRALESYVESKGVLFISYWKSCTQQAYNRLYNTEHRKKRNNGTKAVSWEELEEIHKEKSTEFELLSDLELKEFIASLDGKLQEVAVSLLNGYSKSDIAKMLDIKPASVTYHCKRLESIATQYFTL